MSYEVSTASLPADLKERLKGRQSPRQGELDLQPARAVDAELRWWTFTLGPLLALPRDSAERSAAVDELAGKQLLDWKTRHTTISRTTIYRKLDALELGAGMAGIMRTRRADAGKARTIVSRAWDRAVPFDQATKLKIAGALSQEIREHRSQKMSRKWVLALAQRWLMTETTSRGFTMSDAKAFKLLCTVPMSFYTAEAKYETVYLYEKDRDAFDNQLPRIKRTYKNLRPMELVVADVHPKDLRIRRSDGTIGAARLLAFMDMATRRVRAEIVMIEGRGGVRNIDGIKAFIAMAMDPA